MEGVINAVSEIPFYTWVMMALIVLLIGLFSAHVLRTKNFVIGKFSLTEKEQIKADTTILEDNQLRHGKTHILSIGQLIAIEAKNVFHDMSPLEYAYIKLFGDYIAQKLLDQYRIDLLRNHFTKMPQDQLRIYIEEKANNYYQFIRNYMNNWNESLPRLDFMKIMDRIPYETIYETYKKAYESARSLAAGY